MTTIQILDSSGKQTHKDLLLDNASRWKNLKDMKGFVWREPRMVLCTPGWRKFKFALLSSMYCSLGGINTTRSIPLRECSYNAGIWCMKHVVGMLSWNIQVWTTWKGRVVNQCCHAAQLSRQKSRCFTTALATAHYLPQLVPLDTMLLIFWTLGHSPPLLIQCKSLKAHPFMKKVTPNIAENMWAYISPLHMATTHQGPTSTLTFWIQSRRLHPSGCGERMHHDQPLWVSIDSTI